MKKIKGQGRRIIRYFAILLMINCILISKEVNAYTQGESVSVTLPLEQVFLADGLPVSTSATTFQYEMLPEDQASPMPVGTSNGVYVVSMTGATTTNTTPIVYTHPGVFVYTVKAAMQNDTTGYVADDEEYRTYVYVGRQVDNTLDATVVAMNRANAKVSMLGFSYEMKDVAGGSGDTGSGSGGTGNGDSGLGGIGANDSSLGGTGDGDFGLGDASDGGTNGSGSAEGQGTGNAGANAQNAGSDSGNNGVNGFGNNAKNASVNTGDNASTRILWATIIAMCIVIIYLFHKKQLDFYEQP